ncbi:MAG: hypothetical protein LAQ30_13655 [Acidobacteriia bacterium]|nr:hypothetical protein [Terriglobia bacterium]
MITWSTDVPSTSQVLLVYSNTGLPYRRYPELLDAGMVTAHSVSLSNLTPATQYSFYVASQDVSGGLATSYNCATGSGTVSSFTTASINVAGSPDFRIDLAGAANVTAGSDIYVKWSNVLLSGAADSVTFAGVTGLPSTIALHVICGYNTDPVSEAGDSYVNGAGQQYCYNASNSTFAVRFRTSSSTPPGTYTANVTVTTSTLSKTAGYTFTVAAAPVPPAPPQIASYPPIPNLASWQSTMTTLADKWCTAFAGGAFSFGTESQPWYYDGGRVYLQIGDYTGNMSQWLPCAENVLKQYAAYIGSSGNIPGYRKFPFGLAMHAWRYSDAVSANAVAALYSSVNTPYINGAGPVWGLVSDPNLIRELAYALDCLIAGEESGQPHSRFYDQAVAGMLGIFDQIYVSAPYTSDFYNSAFMGGLAAEALMAHQKRTGDPRVLPAIKAMLDWQWANVVDPQTGAMMYAALEVPPEWATDLNNLIIPAYAWVWLQTGDPLYQQRGDFLFQHALDTDISYSGKIFSQNYKWSFDYVRWRSGNAVSTIEPQANGAAPVIADTAPPTIPAAVQAVFSGNSVQLKWSASTDDVVVAGYRIYRNGALLASAAATSYTDSAIQRNTSYSYAVAAYDAAGNASAQSAATSVSTSNPGRGGKTALPAAVRGAIQP